MSTDQTTIDRLRAELAEARAIATKLQATNRELESVAAELRRDLTGACTERDRLRTRRALLRAFAVGQNARHETLQAPPTGEDWRKLYDQTLGLTQ